MVDRVDEVLRGERLAGNCNRAGLSAALPVKMHGASRAVALTEQILERRVGRVLGRGPRQHDGGVHVAQHTSERLAGRRGAALDDLRVEGLRQGLGQHLEAAEIDSARFHHRIAQVGLELALEAIARTERKHSLARNECEMLHYPFRQGGPIERELRDGWRGRYGWSSCGVSGGRDHQQRKCENNSCRRAVDR